MSIAKNKDRKTFYVQVKNEKNEIEEERGPFTETYAVRLANGMDINMSLKFYTEVIEKDNQ